MGAPEMATPWPCLEQQLFSIFTAVILWRDGLSEDLDSFLLVGQDLLCTFFLLWKAGEIQDVFRGLFSHHVDFLAFIKHQAWRWMFALVNFPSQDQSMFFQLKIHFCMAHYNQDFISSPLNCCKVFWKVLHAAIPLYTTWRALHSLPGEAAGSGWRMLLTIAGTDASEGVNPPQSADADNLSPTVSHILISNR